MSHRHSLCEEGKHRKKTPQKKIPKIKSVKINTLIMIVAL